MENLQKFLRLPFKYHLAFGAIIRLLLILYGDFHDYVYDVPFTDVDYKVFTDASRHVLRGDSPYKRHTYRYSPVIAYLLLPNIIIGKNFGKILFSIFDILVTVAVKRLVQNQLISKDQRLVSRISTHCSLFWLYNPLSIGISTRGNADSVPCFFIIISIYFLLTNTLKSSLKYVLSGALLGISIHLRLYPLAFSFPMYLSLGSYKITRKTSIFKGLWTLMPNKNQIILALSCIITLFALTYGMYYLYGYEFLFETYIYHVFRKDTRHNFSILFYYSYVTMDQLAFDIVKTISLVCECVILFIISLSFGCDKHTLPFALFCQSVVLVAYNSVMTSQYFIWFLSLLPLIVHNLNMKIVHASFLALVWVIAQGAWLFYAYLLEFQCREVFLYIWFMSVVFFSANVLVLGQVIKSYTPGYGFGQLNLVSNKAK